MLALVVLPAIAFAAPATPPVADYASADLMRGFMLTVFGREGPKSSAMAGQYVNKFIDPVSVLVLDNSSVPSREGEVRSFVKLLARTVPNLKIAIADDPAKAQVFVFLVNRSNYRRVIADALPKGDQASFLEGNRCSTIMWNRTTGVLDRAYVFVLADRGDEAFASCLAEELTQALGPANDSDQLPFSLYNDSNDVGTFGLFDWYILSMVYDRDILAGMTQQEALTRLPKAIARLRPKAAAVAQLLASRQGLD
ncbi:DUF2927 domain-containing protein [Mesorhizobium sp. BR1-1-16]|uniref:DUF2927 domain-containing protein n=1 Tax=Mesorhizobium sp. BR1-1-16 TaxID=2876653 RepID=UPI001CCAF2D6|nr:DUF2927 domain-containing protein [Mesorhizobium sp. BR1-1-16]MBZ9937954.1 DUF2927 domain-containing protein [Mesorhizobium sp. BR1-1-16]